MVRLAVESRRILILTVRSRSWLAAVAMVALIAGCAPTTPPSDTGPTPAPSEFVSLCRGGDVRGPDGTAVDLTGTWEGGSTLWFVTQSGSCVTIEGLSRSAGERNGDEYRLVFSGDLGSDFSVRGRWMWTWACNGPACQVRGRTRDVELRVGFASDGETNIEVPSEAFGYPTTFTVSLERTSQSTRFPQ